MTDRWLASAQAAAHVGYRSRAGITSAVRRGQLVPDGRTPGGALRFRVALVGHAGAEVGRRHYSSVGEDEMRTAAGAVLRLVTGSE